MRMNLAVAAALIGVVILVAFFYQSASFSSRAGEDTPLYSVRRHDPYGTAALHDLLVERGNAVRNLERSDLDPSDHGVLIQVLGDGESDEPDRSRTSDLLEWMAEGNTVLQLTQTPTDLMTSKKGMPATRPAGMQDLDDFENSGGPPDQTPASVKIAITSNANRLLLWSPMVFPKPLSAGWKTLARLDDPTHDVIAASMAIGKGKLIVIGAPTPALNGTIGEEGNLDFLLGIIGDQPVILDEWAHGIGHERTIVSFLTDVGLLPMLVQILFVVAVYVWGTSGFHPPAVEKVTRQRSSAEQIETLGYLYSRSLKPAITFERVEKEVQRRLAEALRCQPRDLIAKLATVKQESREKIQQLFARLTLLRSGQGVRCPACGYDLSFNQSGNCPECGVAISPQTQQKIIETQPQAELRARATSPTAPPRARRIKGTYSALAEILTTSHQLTMEITRDRRGPR